MTVPAIRQTAVSTDDVNPSTITYPLGSPLVGNLLVSYEQTEGISGGLFTPPAGQVWTALASNPVIMIGGGASGESARIMWRIATGTEPATDDWTKQGSGAIQIRHTIQEISGGWDSGALLGEAFAIHEVADLVPASAAAITPPAGRELFIAVNAAPFRGTVTGTPTAPLLEDWDLPLVPAANPGCWGGHQIVASSIGSYQPVITWSAVAKWLILVAVFGTALPSRTFAGEPGGGVW